MLTLQEVAKQARQNSERWFSPVHGGEALVPLAAHYTLGLVGEAGEVANVVKKWLRKVEGNPIALGTDLELELADVFTYLVLLADEVGGPHGRLRAQAGPQRGEVGMTLQEQVAWWHRQRFPKAESYHVMIKAMEELGEVAQALNGDLKKNESSVTAGDRDRRGEVPKEAADVVVCLMALLGRWYPDHDLLAEVEKKLAILTDPTSGHRSAALA